MAKVVRIQRKGGQVIQDCDVYIGRACNMGGWNLPQSKWHNPFSAKKYGREKCLEMYREYITSKIRENPELYDLSELKGKILGCWCSPEKCHGDILLELIKSS